MKFFFRQRQKKHNYFSKVKQLTPPSKFSTIQNWKLKLMKGKWYRISKLLSFPPAVGHQRYINLHVQLLYWKFSGILLSDVAGMGCYSCVLTEPQCILLVFHDIAEVSFVPYWFLLLFFWDNLPENKRSWLPSVWLMWQWWVCSRDIMCIHLDLA